MTTDLALMELSTRDGLDEALAFVAHHQREIDRIEAELNDEIDRIKAQGVRLAKEHLVAVAKGTAALKAAAKAGRKELFGEQKTLKLTHGEIFFRTSTALALASKKASWENVLEELTENGRLDAIRIHREVNKEALKTWTAGDLAAIDVRLKTTETVHVKPDVEKLK